MDDQRQILTYALREELGHDRLGRVFRAVDMRTMTGIVLRILRVGALVPESRVEAVRAELRRRLRAAANVAHPNLAPIAEIASHRDLDLVTWDDFAGVPLVARLAAGVPPVERLRWAVEATSAIARAHARGVPHGRITLPNIMIARDDSVRILDLGVPRPKEIPLFVEDDPNGGEPRPVKRNLPRRMRRDLEMLAGVLRQIVGPCPADAPDDTIREEIAAAVEEACHGVLAQEKPTAIMLHRALVDVARRTPAIGRSAGLLSPDPALPTAPPGDGQPGAPAAPANGPEGEPEPLPFTLDDYENRHQDVLRQTKAAAAARHRAWGAAAFEPEAAEESESGPDAAEPDHRDPAVSTVLLPPDTRHPDAPEAEPVSRPPRWTRVLLAGLAGLLFAAGLLALDRATEPLTMPPPQAEESEPADDDESGEFDASATAPGPATATAPAATSGTLVITSAQPNVEASLDDGPFQAVPLLWDRVPAGLHVVQVRAPGFEAQVDTVDIRARLTTTRFFILAPAR